MFSDIIKKFNWVDIFVIIILFRIAYIAIKSGLLVEFFKLLATIAAIYLSLHYYTILSDWIRQIIPITKEKMPLKFLDFLSFGFLVIVGYLIFVSLHLVFQRVIKMEAVPNLNKWGGFVLGIARAFLLGGLITFLFVISSIGYLKTSVNNSYSGKRLLKIAPDTYSWLWNNITSKFMTEEEFNKTILEVQKDLNK